jgi:hypothetical protein
LVLTPMRSAAVRIGFVYPHLSLPALPALSLFSSVSLSLSYFLVSSPLSSLVVGAPVPVAHLIQLQLISGGRSPFISGGSGRGSNGAGGGLDGLGSEDWRYYCRPLYSTLQAAASISFQWPAHSWQ